MKSKGIVRQEKTILFEQSDDESAFSAESTDQESSDAKVRRKKRQRGSSESDDEVTGKSCLEALIFTLVNPQYDNRLFIEFPEKYKFRTCCVRKLVFFLFRHSKQYLYTTCSKLVFFREFNEQSLAICIVG